MRTGLHCVLCEMRVRYWDLRYGVGSDESGPDQQRRGTVYVKT